MIRTSRHRKITPEQILKRSGTSWNAAMESLGMGSDPRARHPRESSRMIHRILFAGAIGVEAWLTGITYLHDTAAKRAVATLAVGAVFVVVDVLLIARSCLRKWAKNRKAKPVRSLSWTTPTQTGRRR